MEVHVFAPLEWYLDLPAVEGVILILEGSLESRRAEVLGSCKEYKASIWKRTQGVTSKDFGRSMARDKRVCGHTTSRGRCKSSGGFGKTSSPEKGHKKGC